MTDRASAASLADETPVEGLPLPLGTVNRLRAAGVLTLGQLRAMPDRELLGLRRFGPRSLADVRALVPAGPGSGALPPGSIVAIGGREFVLGAVYAPRSSRYFRRSRRLLDLDRDGPLPGGRVTVETVPAGVPHVMAGTEWAAWAGEEVDAGEGEAGDRP